MLGELGVIVQQAASRPSTFQEIADGVIVLMVGGIGAYLARKLRIVDDIRDAFGTRPATEFEPARLGVLDQMQAITKAANDAIEATKESTAENAKNTEAVLAMGVRVGQQNDAIGALQLGLGEVRTLVDSHGETLTAIQTGTETLVHESKTNEGGSMRDRVDEISDEQTRVREEKTAADEQKQLDSE